MKRTFKEKKMHLLAMYIIYAFFGDFFWNHFKSAELGKVSLTLFIFASDVVFLISTTCS